MKYILENYSMWASCTGAQTTIWFINMCFQTSKFMRWEKMSKINRPFKRIRLWRLIPKGVLGNQLSFCKLPLTALVNHSHRMPTVSLPAHSTWKSAETCLGKGAFVLYCLTSGCLLLSWFQMICSSGSNSSRSISCKASHRGWFT